MCPPSPPQMCYGIRGGEDSSKRRAWTNGFTYLPGLHLTSSPREVGRYLRRRGQRDSMGCTNHGWHHEPHSPVTNAMCKRWDTPVFTPQQGGSCWDSPLPCTPYFNPDLRLRIPGQLASGFTMLP